MIQMLYSTTTLYNPSEKNREQLINEFVVRTESFDQIFDDIRKAEVGGKKQHYLIVGQRGSGKTTLLYRLKYAIEDNNKIKNKVLALNLGEEQYSVSELDDLWQTVGELLEDFHGYKGLSDHIMGVRSGNDPGNGSWKLINDELEKHKQTIVLLIDNFGDLLKKFSEQEIDDLKSILKKHKTLRLVAGTPFTLESVFNYPKSFFDFLKVVRLKGLTNEDTTKLLLKLGESHGKEELIAEIISNKKERIEILRRLTGGVIRTMVLLFKVFIEDTDGKALQDLQLVLDSVTPLYKHRMDDLPTQQQKIVDAVAKKWDAISVKEISTASRISSKNVSAQLRQLEKNQMIEKIETDSKNHLYHLKERFFNIWYLMRYGRRYDKRRVIWLVRFLESWCDNIELERRILDHIETLNRASGYDKSSAILIGEAYLACSVPTEVKEKLLDVTSKVYPDDFDKTQYDFSNQLIREANQLAQNQELKKSIEKLSKVDINRNTYRNLIKAYLRVERPKKALKVSEKVVEMNIANAKDFTVFGSIYEEVGDYNNALKSYDEAIKKGEERAFLRKADLLADHLNELDEAEELLEQYRIKFPAEISNYYHELAHLKIEREDFKQAESLFKKAIAEGHQGSNYCLGAFYHLKLNDYEKALKYYEKSIKLGGKPYYNLAVLYIKWKKDFNKAVEYFEKAVEYEKHAYYELGRIYEKEFKKVQIAKKHYENAIKHGDERAYHRLAHIYTKTASTKKKAETYFKKAIKSGDNHALACLATYYLKQNRKDKKSEAIRLIEKAKSEVENETYIYDWSATINLWAKRYDQAFEDLKIVLDDTEYLDNDNESIIGLFLDFLSENQHEALIKVFNNEKYQLKDRLKPIYYSLMTMLKHEYPNEYLKMGDELEQTVKEIIEKIKKNPISKRGRSFH